MTPPPLAPVQLGPVRIDFPVALAALSGYSDWPARLIARRLGAGYTIGEVLLDRFVVNVTKGRKARRYIRVSDEERPAAAQLMGSTADELAAAARTLVAAGFDVIDVNFGCPVKKVVGKCRGGYLLSQPEAALEILGRVRDALPPHVPLTVKMRRGMDDGPESRDQFFRIFDGAWALGAAAITVHGRTVRQRYEGRSSWDFLAEVKRHADGRVIFGSGDLFTPDDCAAMIRHTGVDGLTVARGAIGNPWIFRDLRALFAGRPLPPPPTVAEQRAVLLEQLELESSMLGERRAGSVMCQFGIKFARMHPQPIAVRDAFAAAHSLEQFHAVLGKWY